LLIHGELDDHGLLAGSGLDADGLSTGLKVQLGVQRLTGVQDMGLSLYHHMAPACLLLHDNLRLRSDLNLSRG
jgi:hypothetical protein